jgi:bleomycin hydrolase
MLKQKNVTKEMLNEFSAYFQHTPTFKIAQSALLNTKIQDTAMKWERFREINHHFSNVVSNEMKITHQKQSGRCWIFAACNLLRILIGRKHDIDQFELSQNYLMFFDKLEKSNLFLENIINTVEQSCDSRDVMFLLNNPIGDGGQWHMFTNLVKKYGLIPKSAMPDTFQSQNTHVMNNLLLKKLREFAFILRKDISENKSRDELTKRKTLMLRTIHNMLQTFLGNPPETFSWEYYDKKNKFHSIKDLTPQAFLKDHLPVNLSDYVCLINCPMKDTPYNEVYTVKFLGNVIEGDVIRYVNLPIEKLKEYTIASLQKDEPVWFGCDVGQSFHRDQGIMDLDLYDYNTFFNTKFPMNKQDRLEYSESKMTHAMLINGVDLSHGKSTKWRVENSWGKDVGKEGFFIMTDSWFDEYVYEVAIHKRFLPKEIIQLENRDPVVLPPWHPMGSLA